MREAILSGIIGIAVGVLSYYQWVMMQQKRLKSKSTDGVRVRMILGLKNVPYKLMFMESADVETPVGLVGAKQAPILQLPDGRVLKESGDIVTFVDNEWASPSLLSTDLPPNEDLKIWMSQFAKDFYQLATTAYTQCILPEFARKSSREYFYKKKSVSPGLVDKVPQGLKKQLEARLADLEKIYTQIEGQKLCFDHVILFSLLRGVTIIKNITIPKKLRLFTNKTAVRCDVCLYDDIAVQL